MKDYIEYKGKTYQVSTIETDGLFETMIFPIKNGVVSENEVYWCKASDSLMAEYKHQEILNYPESFVSSEAKLQYLKSKEEYSKCKEIPKFPFQYMNKYLNGKMEYNEAVDRTIEEANRLIEEYVKRNR